MPAIILVVLIGFGASFVLLRDNGLADRNRRQSWVLIMSVLAMCLGVLLVWLVMID